MSHHEYKLIVLGEDGVGKSALTIQFIMSQFISEYDPTIEDSYRKQVQIDDEVAMLDILDTSNSGYFYQTDYRSFSDGMVLVYAIDTKSSFSFEVTAKLHRNLLREKDSERIPTILVGNKSDLEVERVVSYGQGEKLADLIGAKFFETSAKYDVNVQEVFRELVREIRKFGKQKSKQNPKKCCLL